MNRRLLFIGISYLSLVTSINAESVDSATCGEMTIADQCHIHWTFSGNFGQYFHVQQFDPLKADWAVIASLPPGTSNPGTLHTPVEGGYLYRVLACDDSEAFMNCSATTMVWAPFVQPESQIHLIPSRVPMVKWEAQSGMPMYAAIDKRSGWLTQVIQYNVYEMTNAIARVDLTNLPEMTAVKDIRTEAPSDPIEQVQFNVYWAYSAERGNPIESPAPPAEVRPPHKHPERHSQ